jgi:hypothetical protein
MIALATIAAVLGFYALFYSRAVKRWAPAVRVLVGRLRLDQDHPVRDVDAVGKLAAATVGQALFAGVLLLATGASGGSLFDLHWELVALGAVLGIGELAFAGLLGSAAVQVAALVSHQGHEREAWLARSHGGWMGYFTATVRVAPVWFSTIIISAYVAVEELVFRGILITVLAQHGEAIAVGVPLALFVAAQAFGLPGLRASLLPITGAAVIGATHGVVFWHVREIVPLMAAHLTFFSGALIVTMSAGGRPAPLLTR